MKCNQVNSTNLVNQTFANRTIHSLSTRCLRHEMTAGLADHFKSSKEYQNKTTFRFIYLFIIQSKIHVRLLTGMQ